MLADVITEHRSQRSCGVCGPAALYPQSVLPVKGFVPFWGNFNAHQFAKYSLGLDEILCDLTSTTSLDEPLRFILTTRQC